MNFAGFVKGISERCDSALSVVAQKAENLDVTLERRKLVRELEEKYDDVSAILVKSLVTLDEETLSTFPHFVQEEIAKLNSIKGELNKQYEAGLAEKGYKTCTNCDCEMPVMYSFCPKCGTKQF